MSPTRDIECRDFAEVGCASLCIVLRMEQPAPRRSKIVSIRYAQSVWLRTRWSQVRVPPGAPIIHAETAPDCEPGIPKITMSVVAGDKDSPIKDHLR